MGHRGDFHKKAVATNKQDLKGKAAVDALSSVLSLFPSYASLFQQTQSQLLEGNGPLSLPERHFIAIMACRVSGCVPLLHQERSLFLSTGGSASWLNSSVAIPLRLSRLSEVNRLLNKAPHLITAKHIKRLTMGEGCMTLAEVVQALVTLVIFHALSSFYVGCDFLQSEKEELMKNYDTMIDTKSAGLIDIYDESFPRKQWSSIEKDLKRKRSFSEGELIQQKELNTKTMTNKSVSKTNLNFTCHEFSKEKVRIQDFSWDDQGFSMMSNFYTDIAFLIDDKFRLSRSLQMKSQRGKKIGSQSLFRQGLWNYVQGIHGILHDDYEYSEIKENVGDNIRLFVDICCLPPSLELAEKMEKIGEELNYSEKVHVSILVMEARLQSGLLFALQAVMKHIK